MSDSKNTVRKVRRLALLAVTKDFLIHLADVYLGFQANRNQDSKKTGARQPDGAPNARRK